MPPEYTPAVVARFFAKVGPDGRWTAVHTPKGYGQFSLCGRMVRAHRVAWEIANGRKVPAGMDVLHSCDIRDCVLPGCLWLGTDLDNNQDMVAKGRQVYVHGERVGTARLAAADVRAIRAAYASGGLTQEMLARRYNVNRATIGRIVTGEQWAKV